MNLNTLSQLIYEELIHHSINKGSETDQTYLTIVTGLRNILIRQGDPSIHMKVEHVNLLMNLSHQLPLLRALHPLYDTALPRIAKAILEQEKYVKVIDIGANIGDTTSSISQAVTGSFLCIEGDPHYFSILQENVKYLNAHVVCVNALCGQSDCQVQGHLKTEHGTGHFLPGADKGTVQLMSINTILENNIYFKDANLFKVDTDGFDTCILRGAQKLLTDIGPTVFFEYVPALIARHGEEPLAIFSYLSNLGYRFGLFYSNLGFPLKIIDICNQRKLEEMVSHIDKGAIGYYDILLPGRNLDHDMFIAFCQNEISATKQLLRQKHSS